jgi:hypothetical protein
MNVAKLTVKDRTNKLWVHPPSVKERAERIERTLSIVQVAILNAKASPHGSAIIIEGVSQLLNECIQDAWVITQLDADVVDRLAPTPDELTQIIERSGAEE